MRSYLEHEAQPRLVLKETRRTLKTGDIVYVRVPNYGSLNRRVMGNKWCGFRFPDHVNYFTSKHLKRLAASCGFTYRRINWLSPFDDNLIVEFTANN
ncbi:MAG: methyltransferase domain-containing protein [Hyphomicrobium sp.]